MTTTTIDEVIERLSAVVEDSIATESRIGYFAALYRQVTIEVQRAIVAGEFEDGERMSRFDAAFGDRYFVAFDQWRAMTDPTRSWRAAFRLTDEDDTIIVQHLLLGINAHINLDLAVAAAEVAPGAAITDLQNDFFLINDILVRVLNKVQEAIDQVSPFMRLLDDVGGRSDEHILDFNIRKARGEAWRHALLLAGQPPEQQLQTIALLDARATLLARVLAEPRWVMRSIVEVIRLTENTDIPTVIKLLDNSLDA